VNPTLGLTWNKEHKTSRSLPTALWENYCALRFLFLRWCACTEKDGGRERECARTCARERLYESVYGRAREEKKTGAQETMKDRERKSQCESTEKREVERTREYERARARKFSEFTLIHIKALSWHFFFCVTCTHTCVSNSSDSPKRLSKTQQPRHPHLLLTLAPAALSPLLHLHTARQLLPAQESAQPCTGVGSGRVSCCRQVARVRAHMEGVSAWVLLYFSSVVLSSSLSFRCFPDRPLRPCGMKATSKTTCWNPQDTKT